MAAQGQQFAYFDELCAAVEQLGRLRWTLRLVITLADDANALTDEQLRTQLLTLAERAARLSAVANSPDPHQICPDCHCAKDDR